MSDTVLTIFFDHVVNTGVERSIACYRRSITWRVAQKKKKRREKIIKRTGVITGKRHLLAQHAFSSFSSVLFSFLST